MQRVNRGRAGNVAARDRAFRARGPKLERAGVWCTMRGEMLASADPPIAPAPPLLRWVAAAITAAIVAIGAVCLLDGARRLERPFAGFFIGPNRVVLSVVRPGWSLAHAARVSSAQLIAIDGRPIEDPLEIEQHVATLAPGTPILYRFRKDADVFTEAIAVKRFERGDYLGLYVIYFAAGLCFATAGLWARWRAERTPAATAFFIFCQTAALLLMTNADLYGPYRFAAVYFTAQCLTPAALLYFAASYPAAIGYRSRARRMTLAATAGSAIALALALNLARSDPGLFGPLSNAVFLLLANAGLLYLARLLIGVLSTESPAWRASLRFALAAVLLPALVPEALFVIYPAIEGPIPSVILIGPLAAFPLLTVAALRQIRGAPELGSTASIRLRLSLLFLGVVETAFLIGVAMLWLNNSRERLLDDYALNRRQQARVERFLTGLLPTLIGTPDAASNLAEIDALVQTSAERQLVSTATVGIAQHDFAMTRGAVNRLGEHYREEERRLNDRRAWMGRLAVNLVLDLIVLGIVQAVGFMIAVNRWLIRPIAQLAAGTDVFPAHWDPKLRIPRGQVVAAASIVSPKY